MPLSLSNKSFKGKRKAIFRGSKITALLRLNVFYSGIINFNWISIKRFFTAPFSSNIQPCPKSRNFPTVTINKKFVFYKSRNFLRVNNLQFVIKKKLNLRKQKIFFYSVHIAAPKKKTKK
jgi:hypothetical protein